MRERLNWRKLALWLLVALPLGPFVLATVVITAYMYLPITYDELKPTELNSGAEHISIAAHGLRDTANSWALPLMHSMQSSSSASDRIAQHLAIDWNPYSQNTFRCSVDGKRIGYQLGVKLSALPNLKSVDLIGHSCGAFVVLGACEAIKSQNPDIVVRSTYLDPVSIYGGFFWRYGLGKFGSCADISDAYIDTGDSVPGSNQALPYATTHNVTQARIDAGYRGSPHVWPTVYYQQLIASPPDQ